MCTVNRLGFDGIKTENGGEKKHIGRELYKAVSDDIKPPEWTPMIVRVQRGPPQMNVAEKMLLFG